MTSSLTFLANFDCFCPQNIPTNDGNASAYYPHLMATNEKRMLQRSMECISTYLSGKKYNTSKRRSIIIASVNNIIH